MSVKLIVAEACGDVDTTGDRALLSAATASSSIAWHGSVCFFVCALRRLLRPSRRGVGFLELVVESVTSWTWEEDVVDHVVEVSVYIEHINATGQLIKAQASRYKLRLAITDLSPEVRSVLVSNSLQFYVQALKARQGLHGGSKFLTAWPWPSSLGLLA